MRLNYMNNYLFTFYSASLTQRAPWNFIHKIEELAKSTTTTTKKRIEQRGDGGDRVAAARKATKKKEESTPIVEAQITITTKCWTTTDTKSVIDEVQNILFHAIFCFFIVVVVVVVIFLIKFSW